jgi:uncharacterized protein YerC
MMWLLKFFNAATLFDFLINRILTKENRKRVSDLIDQVSNRDDLTGLEKRNLVVGMIKDIAQDIGLEALKTAITLIVERNKI